MNKYISPEEEERIKQRDEERSRYRSQLSVSEALNNLILHRKNEIKMAEDVQEWLRADRFRDASITDLDSRLKRLIEKQKTHNTTTTKELQNMENRLSKHLYDDFDWEAEYRRVRDCYYDLRGKFAELEKEHRMLMKKILGDD